MFLVRWLLGFVHASPLPISFSQLQDSNNFLIRISIIIWNQSNEILTGLEIPENVFFVLASHLNPSLLYTLSQ